MYYKKINFEALRSLLNKSGYIQIRSESGYILSFILTNMTEEKDFWHPPEKMEHREGFILITFGKDNMKAIELMNMLEERFKLTFTEKNNFNRYGRVMESSRVTYTNLFAIFSFFCDFYNKKYRFRKRRTGIGVDYISMSDGLTEQMKNRLKAEQMKNRLKAKL